MGNFVTGIDIGSSKICGAIGKIDKLGNLQIIGITSVTCSGIKKALIEDVDSVSEGISQCVKELENMAEMQISSVFASLPIGICELIESKGSINVSSEENIINSMDVRKVLEAAKSISIGSEMEVVDIIPKDYSVDGYDNVKNPIGIGGTRLEAVTEVIAADTQYLNDFYKCFNKVGIRVEGVLLQPLGTSEVIITKDEKEQGVALIDVGADTTSISIFKNGTICFMDAIPLGGNTITNDICVCLKLSFEEAERIKVKFGNVGSVSNEDEYLIKVVNTFDKTEEIKYSILSDIISARVEEMLTFIYKDIRKSGYYDMISNMVISGGGISLFNDINAISQEILGKNVKIVSPEYVGASSPLYSDCIGIIQPFYYFAYFDL